MGQIFAASSEYRNFKPKTVFRNQMTHWISNFAKSLNQYSESDVDFFIAAKYFFHHY